MFLMLLGDPPAPVVFYSLLLRFGVAGALKLARVGTVPVGLRLLAASIIESSLLFFPWERFRIPLLDPNLIVLAGHTQRFNWSRQRAEAFAGPQG